MGLVDDVEELLHFGLVNGPVLRRRRCRDEVTEVLGGLPDVSEARSAMGENLHSPTATCGRASRARRGRRPCLLSIPPRPSRPTAARR